MAKYYTRITLKRMSELLDLSIEVRTLICLCTIFNDHHEKVGPKSLFSGTKPMENQRMVLNVKEPAFRKEQKVHLIRIVGRMSYLFS